MIKLFCEAVKQNMCENKMVPEIRIYSPNSIIRQMDTIDNSMMINNDEQQQQQRKYDWQLNDFVCIKQEKPNEQIINIKHENVIVENEHNHFNLNHLKQSNHHGQQHQQHVQQQISINVHNDRQVQVNKNGANSGHLDDCNFQFQMHSQESEQHQQLLQHLQPLQQQQQQHHRQTRQQQQQILQSSIINEMTTTTNNFQMRTINLNSFPPSSSSNRVNYRTVLNRAKIGITTGTAKSLNILRQTLQNRINNEINEIMQKYLQDYFQPAAENIRKNFGSNSISEQHLQAICRQILEDAKSMYFGPLLSRCNSPPMTGNFSSIACNNDMHSVENEQNLADEQHRELNTNSIVHNKRVRRDSDPDVNINHDVAATSSTIIQPPVKCGPGRKKKIRPNNHHPHAKVKSSTHSSQTRISVQANDEKIRRESPNWDPNRLTVATKFVLGSKANKALGFGSTRGRLYTKHSCLFRYIGDQEDKQWLHEHGLMPLAGGRAYLIIKEDIENLIESDEYRGAPGVNSSDMGAGFTVPESMIVKMRALMEAMRNSSEQITTKTKVTSTINAAAVAGGMKKKSPLKAAENDLRAQTPPPQSENETIFNSTDTNTTTDTAATNVQLFPDVNDVVIEEKELSAPLNIAQAATVNTDEIDIDSPVITANSSPYSLTAVLNSNELPDISLPSDTSPSTLSDIQL